MQCRDHYSFNVARRIKPDTEAFGPWHSHMFRAMIEGTKAEATEVYEDLCRRYPEPEFRVMLCHVSVRTGFLRDSGGIYATP